MPRPCSSATVFPYRSGHNPAVWFTDLGSPSSGGDGSCKLDDVPFSTSTFDPSTLGSFTWVTPNQRDEMHWVKGCGAEDRCCRDRRHLAAGVSGDVLCLTRPPAGQHSGDGDVGRGQRGRHQGIDRTTVANIDTSGCHVALIAAGVFITPGTVDATPYSDHSVLDI